MLTDEILEDLLEGLSALTLGNKAGSPDLFFEDNDDFPTQTPVEFLA